jgi:hypothetical protein
VWAQIASRYGKLPGVRIPDKVLAGETRIRLDRQRPMRRANPDLPPPPPPDTYAAPPDRCPLRRDDHHFAAIIIPGQSRIYRHLRDRVTGLLAESGLTSTTRTPI